jgi:high-affinity iron transporter
MDFSSLAVLKPFIITLREGFEIALIVGILYSYIAKKEDAAAKNMVWLGLALAGVISVGFGVGLLAIQTSIPQSYGQLMEGILAFISAGFLLYMVLWMNHAGVSKELRGAVDEAAETATPLWGIFSIAFTSVLREGFETVIFLHTAAEKQTSNDVVMSYSLAVLGLIIAAIIGYYIFARSSKLPMREIFSYTSLLLVLFAAWMIFVGFTATGFGWYGGRENMPQWLNIVRYVAGFAAAGVGLNFWRQQNKK